MHTSKTNKGKDLRNFPLSALLFSFFFEQLSLHCFVPVSNKENFVSFKSGGRFAALSLGWLDFVIIQLLED